MTTRKIYKCNFCRDEVLPDEMYGFEWNAGDTLLLEEARRVENHLCKKCFLGIYRLGMQFGIEATSNEKRA